MRHWIGVLALISVMTAVVCSEAVAKPKMKTVYMFGISTDYADSVMYMTDIHTMTPVYIESKTGFLYDRTIYSQQLQVYVEGAMNKPLTTCVVFFDTSLKALEKKFAKVFGKAKSKERLQVVPIDRKDFRFIPEEWTEHEKI